MNYIIISLKHSTKKQICFWRANDAGYTNYPFNAGLYSQEKIDLHPDYYNNGVSTLAIPLTENALDEIGFKFSIDAKKLKELADKVEAKNKK